MCKPIESGGTCTPSPKPTQSCVPMFDSGALQCSNDKNAPTYKKCCQDYPGGVYCKETVDEKRKNINICMPEPRAQVSIFDLLNQMLH